MYFQVPGTQHEAHERGDSETTEEEVEGEGLEDVDCCVLLLFQCFKFVPTVLLTCKFTEKTGQFILKYL